MFADSIFWTVSNKYLEVILKNEEVTVLFLKIKRSNKCNNA